jgi:hypothetical protein
MDHDLIQMSLYNWQQKLSLMAQEMMDVAEEQVFDKLYDVMSLVTDAAARIDEIRPRAD